MKTSAACQGGHYLALQIETNIKQGDNEPHLVVKSVSIKNCTEFKSLGVWRLHGIVFLYHLMVLHYCL